jgi:hypothetical protein
MIRKRRMWKRRSSVFEVTAVARLSVRSSWTNMQKEFTKSCKQAWCSLQTALWQLQLIPARNLYTCLPIWAKFCTGNPYESPLRNCELSEDGLSKNCCLIKEVQYVNLRPYFLHSSCNVDKIQCRTCLQKLSETVWVVYRWAQGRTPFLLMLIN